jgi:transketolase N-terminal domain/subunit
MVIKELEKRLLEVAYKNKLGHLGSYFSSLPIVNEIYSKMKKDDIFILSSGHASLSMYVCIEKYQGGNAEELFLKHGGHPHRDEQNGIYCSTGSLGLGLCVALGRAVANKKRNVWVLISDGEAAEGSIWESLKTIWEEKIDNIKVFVNVNGLCAYKEVDKEYLSNRLKSFLPNINIRYTTVERFSFLRGLNAHYRIMDDHDYKTALKELDQ